MNIDIKDFIIKNERLIYSVINKYSKYYEKDDLYQVAVMGIVKAYRKYDPKYNTKFLSYAYKYILGEVIYFVNNNRSVKVNNEILGLNKKIQEAKTLLTQKLMKEPTTLELSLFLEIDEGIINEVITATMDSDSLDRVISEDGKNLLLIDTIPSSKEEYNIDCMLLKDEINKLPDNERKILEYRYFSDKTQSEIAKTLGIYQVQVSRGEQKGLKILKKSLQKSA